MCPLVCGFCFAVCYGILIIIVVVVTLSIVLSGSYGDSVSHIVGHIAVPRGRELARHGPHIAKFDQIQFIETPCGHLKATVARWNTTTAKHSEKQHKIQQKQGWK